MLVEGEIFIDLIREDQRTRMGLDERRDFVELGTGEYFPGGVLGGVQEEEAGARGEGGREFVPVEVPGGGGGGGGTEGDVDADATGHFDLGGRKEGEKEGRREGLAI